MTVVAGAIATWYFALHMISGVPGDYRSKSQVVFFTSKASCERVLAKVQKFDNSGAEYHRYISHSGGWESKRHSHFYTKTCRKIPTGRRKAV